MLTHFLKITTIVSFVSAVSMVNLTLFSVAMEPIDVKSVFFLTKESIEKTGITLAEEEQNYKNRQTACRILAAKKLKQKNIGLNFKAEYVDYSENIKSLQEKVEILNRSIEKSRLFLVSLLRIEIPNQYNLFLRLYAAEIFHASEANFRSHYIVYWTLAKKIWELRENMSQDLCLF